VLILLAVVLLVVLPSPWNLIAFILMLPVWVLELVFWSRTVRGRRRAVGTETMIGRHALVISPCHPLGQVRLDGEIWQARCDGGAESGDTVRVTALDRLTLVVEKVAPTY
jgi:membrane-bound serine protease (ClpP class)